jgi:hypothetical protein
MTDRIVLIYLSLLGLNAIIDMRTVTFAPVKRRAQTRYIRWWDWVYIVSRRDPSERWPFGEDSGNWRTRVLGASVKVNVQARYIRWGDWICIVSGLGPSQRTLGTDRREVVAAVRIRNEEQMRDIPIYAGSGRFSNCARLSLSANCAVLKWVINLTLNFVPPITYVVIDYGMKQAGISPTPNLQPRTKMHAQ